MKLNRKQVRKTLKDLKKLSPRELRDEMNTIHTRAYELAEKHYQEALFIITTPKVQQAVIEKAKEIREKWDGIREITIETTEVKR